MNCKNAPTCKGYTPAPDPHDLGKWRGIRLFFSRDTGTVTAEQISDNRRITDHWKPGRTMEYAAHHPEMCNALLTAYRRAVARGLATWPQGWEWAGEEMPEWFNCPAAEKDCGVYLGRFSVLAGDINWYLGWSGRSVMTSYFCGTGGYIIGGGHPAATESRRRAAMLGLCEPEPVRPPKPFEPGAWVGRQGATVAYLANEVECIDGIWRWRENSDYDWLPCANWQVVKP